MPACKMPHDEAQLLFKEYTDDLAAQAEKAYLEGDILLGEFILDLVQEILEYRMRALRFQNLQMLLKKERLTAYIKSLK